MNGRMARCLVMGCLMLGFLGMPGLLGEHLNAAAQGTSFGEFEVPIPGLSKGSIDDFAKKTNPFRRYLGFIVKTATAVIVLIGLGATVGGGYLYMTAGGNGSRVTQAKVMISSGLLGIALALASITILNTVNPDLANPKEPSIGP